MKKICAKCKRSILLIAIIVVIFVIPGVLMKWDATNPFGGQVVGDWVGYFGSLFGSIVSIVGIYWTLEDNRKQQEEQNRKEVFPHISLSNTVFGKAKNQLFDELKYEDKDGKITILGGNRQFSKKVKSISYIRTIRTQNKDTTDMSYLRFKVNNFGKAAAFITGLDIYIKNKKEYSTTNVKVYKDGNQNRILCTIGAGREHYIALTLAGFEFSSPFESHQITVTCHIEDLFEREYILDKDVEFKKEKSRETSEDCIQVLGLHDKRIKQK